MKSVIGRGDNKTAIYSVQAFRPELRLTQSPAPGTISLQAGTGMRNWGLSVNESLRNLKKIWQ